MRGSYYDNIDMCRLQQARTLDEAVRIEKEIERKECIADYQAKQEVLSKYRWAKRNQYGYWEGISKKETQPRRSSYVSNYSPHLASLHRSALRSRVKGLLSYIDNEKDLKLFYERFTYGDLEFIITINDSQVKNKRGFFEYYKNKIMFYKHKEKVIKKFNQELYHKTVELGIIEKKVDYYDFK